MVLFEVGELVILDVEALRRGVLKDVQSKLPLNVISCKNLIEMNVVGYKVKM